MKNTFSKSEFTKKRKLIMDMITTVFSILDKSGKNTKYYIEKLSTLNDDQFHKWLVGFLEDDKKNFYLEVLPYESEPTLVEIKKAADYLKVPLEEHVYFPTDGDKEGAIESNEKVVCGYLLIKKMQQMLEKKNTYSINIDQRSSKTQQLTRDDKIARITDLESIALTTFGANEALKEFLGPRGDDMKRKQQMYKKVMEEGAITNQELISDVTDRTTLNTVDIYFTAGGIRTDLIDPVTMEMSRRVDREDINKENVK